MYSTELLIDLDEWTYNNELEAQKLHKNYFAFIDCNICKWDLCKLWRAYIWITIEEQIYVDTTLFTQNQLHESRNWPSRVFASVSGTPRYIHARFGRLDCRRPWDTSVTRDLLVKSVIRR